jgi:hypothetical protein
VCMSLLKLIIPATGRKKWDLSHFSSTALFILSYVGIDMFVQEHLQAQSYWHMIGLDDVAQRLHRWAR